MLYSIAQMCSMEPKTEAYASALMFARIVCIELTKNIFAKHQNNVK